MPMHLPVPDLPVRLSHQFQIHSGCMTEVTLIELLYRNIGISQHSLQSCPSSKIQVLVLTEMPD